MLTLPVCCFSSATDLNALREGFQKYVSKLQSPNSKDLVQAHRLYSPQVDPNVRQGVQFEEDGAADIQRAMRGIHRFIGTSKDFHMASESDGASRVREGQVPGSTGFGSVGEVLSVMQLNGKLVAALTKRQSRIVAGAR